MSGRTVAELFTVDDDTDFDPEFSNALIREISRRLASLEILRQGLEAAFSQAQEITLLRVNDILGPAALTVNGMIATLNGMLATAQAALLAGTTEALASIQPLINNKLSEVDTALAALATAISQANAARDSATAAATSANAAAASITDVRRGTATVITTTGQTAAVGGRYKIDTSGGAISLNLPAAPVEGEHVTAWREGTNAATLARNGKTIEGLSENLVIDKDKTGVRLTYLFGTWKAFPAEVML